MTTYTAFGFAVESDVQFPELEATCRDPEIRVRVGKIDERPDETVEDGKLYRIAGGHYVTVGGVGTLFARGGETLVVDPTDDADAETIRQYVLGQGFRVLLYQQGYLVLHASAAVVDGRGVGFVGQSGQGKSTTAGAFYAAGYPVLTDDVLAVDPGDATIRPGFRHVKLDRPAAASLGADLAPTGDGDRPRRYYAATPEGDDDPVPLGRLYVLADGPDVRIETLSPSERTYELMCASSSAYHSADDDEVEVHLDDCVRLSSAVPVKRLERPREYDALPAVVRAVEADLDGAPEEVRSE